MAPRQHHTLLVAALLLLSSVIISASARINKISCQAIYSQRNPTIDVGVNTGAGYSGIEIANCDLVNKHLKFQVPLREPTDPMFEIRLVSITVDSAGSSFVPTNTTLRNLRIVVEDSKIFDCDKAFGIDQAQFVDNVELRVERTSAVGSTSSFSLAATTSIKKSRIEVVASNISVLGGNGNPAASFSAPTIEDSMILISCHSEVRATQSNVPGVACGMYGNTVGSTFRALRNTIKVHDSTCLSEGKWVSVAAGFANQKGISQAMVSYKLTLIEIWNSVISATVKKNTPPVGVAAAGYVCAATMRCGVASGGMQGIAVRVFGTSDVQAKGTAGGQGAAAAVGFATCARSNSNTEVILTTSHWSLVVDGPSNVLAELKPSANFLGAVAAVGLAVAVSSTDEDRETKIYFVVQVSDIAAVGGAIVNSKGHNGAVAAVGIATYATGVRSYNIFSFPSYSNGRVRLNTITQTVRVICQNNSEANSVAQGSDHSSAASIGVVQYGFQQVTGGGSTTDVQNALSVASSVTIEGTNTGTSTASCPGNAKMVAGSQCSGSTCQGSASAKIKYCGTGKSGNVGSGGTATQTCTAAVAGPFADDPVPMVCTQTPTISPPTTPTLMLEHVIPCASIGDGFTGLLDITPQLRSLQYEIVLENCHFVNSNVTFVIPWQPEHPLTLGIRSCTFDGGAFGARYNGTLLRNAMLRVSNSHLVNVDNALQLLNMDGNPIRTMENVHLEVRKSIITSPADAVVLSSDNMFSCGVKVSEGSTITAGTTGTTHKATTLWAASIRSKAIFTSTVRISCNSTVNVNSTLGALAGVVGHGDSLQIVSENEIVVDSSHVSATGNKLAGAAAVVLHNNGSQGVPEVKKTRFAAVNGARVIASASQPEHGRPAMAIAVGVGVVRDVNFVLNARLGENEILASNRSVVTATSDGNSPHSIVAAVGVAVGLVSPAFTGFGSTMVTLGTTNISLTGESTAVARGDGEKSAIASVAVAVICQGGSSANSQLTQTQVTLFVSGSSKASAIASEGFSSVAAVGVSMLTHSITPRTVLICKGCVLAAMDSSEVMAVASTAGNMSAVAAVGFAQLTRQVFVPALATQCTSKYDGAKLFASSPSLLLQASGAGAVALVGAQSKVPELASDTCMITLVDPSPTEIIVCDNATRFHSSGAAMGSISPLQNGNTTTSGNCTFPVDVELPEVLITPSECGTSQTPSQSSSLELTGSPSFSLSGSLSPGTPSDTVSHSSTIEPIIVSPTQSRGSATPTAQGTSTQTPPRTPSASFSMSIPPVPTETETLDQRCAPVHQVTLSPDDFAAYRFRRANGRLRLRMTILESPNATKLRPSPTLRQDVLVSGAGFGETALQALVQADWGRIENANITSPKTVEFDLVATMPLGRFPIYDDTTVKFAFSFDSPALLNCSGGIEAATVASQMQLRGTRRPIAAAAYNSIVSFGTASAGFSGAAANNPMVAMVQARSSMVAALANCQFSHTEPLSPDINPLGWKAGGAVGAYYRGTLVGDAFLLIILAIFTGALTLVFYDPRRPKRRLWRVFGVAHLPGVLVVPFSMSLTGSSMAAVALIVHGPEPLDKALATGALTLTGLIMVLCAWKTTIGMKAMPTAREPEDAKSGELSAGAKFMVWLYLSDTKWINDPDDKSSEGFKDHWQNLFTDFRPGFCWYLTLEMLVSAVMGALTGIAIEEYCDYVKFTLCALLLCQAAGAVFIRPFITAFETTFHIVLSVLTFISTIVIVSMTDNESALDFAVYVELIVAFIAFIKLCFDIGNLMRWFHSRYLLWKRNPKRKGKSPLLLKLFDWYGSWRSGCLVRFGCVRSEVDDSDPTSSHAFRRQFGVENDVDDLIELLERGEAERPVDIEEGEEDDLLLGPPSDNDSILQPDISAPFSDDLQPDDPEVEETEGVGAAGEGVMSSFDIAEAMEAEEDTTAAMLYEDEEPEDENSSLMPLGMRGATVTKFGEQKMMFEELERALSQKVVTASVAPQRTSALGEQPAESVTADEVELL